MKHKFIIIALLVICCGCAHPLIGRSVFIENNKYWCRSNSFNDCIVQTEHLIFKYSVTLIDPVAGEYIIKGHAEPVNIGAFSNFQTEKSTFYFLLAKYGIITDVVSFMMGSNSVQEKIPFNLKFKTKPFDATAILYEFWVSG